MYKQDVSHPSNNSQPPPEITYPDSFSGIESGTSTGGLCSSVEGELPEYFLIQGNKVSTASFSAGSQAFDDFKPNHSADALKDRLKRYAASHSRALKMGEWIKENITRKTLKGLNLSSLLVDLENCGAFLIFRYFFTVDTVKLAGMCSCHKHLLCPLCAIRRAAKSVKAYLDRFNVLTTEHPKMKPYLVTFTIKDGENLTERFDHLQDCLRFYYGQRRKSLSSSSRHSRVEACKALGGVGSFEVKRGSGSGSWHPHAHYIWLCNEAPNCALLSQEWHALTGDSFIVDVTPFHDGKDVSEGFLEVFKYALKTSTMDHADNWEAFMVLRGRRLVSSFGIFRGVDIPESMCDEFDEADLPYYEMIFRYLEGSYQLDKSTIKAVHKPTGRA